MYLPKSFAEDRLPVLHDAIRAAGLATLVTVTAEGPVASHIPMLLDAGSGERGTLLGHVARANPQWRDTIAGTPALAIFLGPDAYVSPTWYPSKQETGKVVPTWNYIAIHAYGPLHFFEDKAPLLDIVTRLTQTHEGKRLGKNPGPWAVTDAPADYIDAMLKAIVGFELPIARLEGKWKLSQNKSAADIAGIRDGLAVEPDEDAAALARAMSDI